MSFVTFQCPPVTLRNSETMAEMEGRRSAKALATKQLNQAEAGFIDRDDVQLVWTDGSNVASPPPHDTLAGALLAQQIAHTAGGLGVLRFRHLSEVLSEAGAQLVIEREAQYNALIAQVDHPEQPPGGETSMLDWAVHEFTRGFAVLVLCSEQDEALSLCACLTVNQEPQDGDDTGLAAFALSDLAVESTQQRKGLGTRIIKALQAG